MIVWGKKKIFLIIPIIVLMGLFCFSLSLMESSEITNSKDLTYHHSFFSGSSFYDEAYKIGARLQQDKQQTVYGGIVPHHLMVRDYIAGFFLGLENQEYKEVIIISPNHFQIGNKGIITSEAAWKTPYGEIYHNFELVKLISELGNAEINELPFENEHGITGLVPFIKKSFPKARITPIILEENLNKKEAEELAKLISDNVNPEKTLVLASVDFSHYQTAKVADYHDERSNSIIQNFDFDRIYDMEIDSPASIYTVLKYLELQKSKKAEKIYSTNSGNLLKNFDEPTTSHNFYYFSKGDETKSKTYSFLFLGDMMIDRHVGTLIERKGFDYLFEKIKTEENRFFRGQDIISVNLEGAVTNNGEHYLPEYANDFAFNPKIVKQLKKYNFNFLNLANNHFSDQSEKGVEETRKNLDELGFNYSGCIDKEVGECSTKIVEVFGKKIGMVGASMVYGTFDIEKLKSQITELKTKTDLIVLNIHWGVEYEHQFNKLQQNIAHELVDAGVDIVIGHHPHVVQGVEIYNGHPIFYSLGNFIFDQYFSPDTQEGLALGVNYLPEKIEIYLFPTKSKSSQVELMSEKEKTVFFERLLKWSPNLYLAGQVNNGKIEINIKN